MSEVKNNITVTNDEEVDFISYLAIPCHRKSRPVPHQLSLPTKCTKHIFPFSDHRLHVSPRRRLRPDVHPPLPPPFLHPPRLSRPGLGRGKVHMPASKRPGENKNTISRGKNDEKTRNFSYKHFSSKNTLHNNHFCTIFPSCHSPPNKTFY